MYDYREAGCAARRHVCYTVKDKKDTGSGRLEAEKHLINRCERRHDGVERNSRASTHHWLFSTFSNCLSLLALILLALKMVRQRREPQYQGSGIPPSADLRRFLCGVHSHRKPPLDLRACCSVRPRVCSMQHSRSLASIKQHISNVVRDKPTLDSTGLTCSAAAAVWLILPLSFSGVTFVTFVPYLILKKIHNSSHQSLDV